MSILIIEDDRLLNTGIAHSLSKEGYHILKSESYEEGLKLFREEMIDLILLDINLSGKSGIDLCKEVRSESKVPIIFITAKDTDKDMIEGFDAGCDDYIAKPFSLVVLKKRVQALLRRSKLEDDTCFCDRGITVHFKKKVLLKHGVPIKLTATEYKIVELLTQNKGQVLTREMLLEKLWDIDGNFVEANTLSVHMRRLRMKIEDDPKAPKWIVTVFGIGYTWGE